MRRFAPLLLLPFVLAGCEKPPLQGRLVYEPDVPEGRRGTPVDIDMLAATVRRRVRPLRPRPDVRALPGGRIEVAVYGTDPGELQRVDQVVQALGTLEFRVLANRRDHLKIIEQAEKDEAGQILDEDGNLLAWWVPVAKGNEDGLSYPEIATRRTTHEGSERLKVLVVNDPFNVNGGYLSRVTASLDAQGLPCIRFQFNSSGGKLFEGLTAMNLPDEVQNFSRKLGIILDGQLHSAPAIRSTIGAHGEITGNFTQQEVDNLVAVLNAGTLPVPIRKVGGDGDGLAD